MESTSVIKESRENVFLQLYNYDFESCPKFVEGWKKIRQSITENFTESFVKAQVFFYSRQVEPVNLRDYVLWLQASGKAVKVIDIDDIHIEKDLSSATSTNNEQSSNSTGDVTIPGKHPSNFGELVEMIQNGIKLPGVEELNIEPTYETPSTAKLDRPKKPWES